MTKKKNELEFESDKVKAYVQQIQAEKGILAQQLDQLKSENDELKKLLKVRIEDLCDSCGASSMIPIPCKVYEKTLTEIKTDILDIREGISYFWVIDKCDEILQKISECEGNDEDS